MLHSLASLPPLPASLLLPLKAGLLYSGILDTLHSTASRLAGKDERKKTGAKTEVNSGRWMDGFC